VLSSIVSNLVRNAITHMGARELRHVRIRVGPGETTEAVRIEVEDTGPGIPEALGDRIFEAFVRGAGADQSGIGLGLATVKRLVTAHGGNVGFRSRAGVGTLFFVDLPRARELHQPS
jgi:signal transduction histidine kinase